MSDSSTWARVIPHTVWSKYESLCAALEYWREQGDKKQMKAVAEHLQHLLTVYPDQEFWNQQY